MLLFYASKPYLLLTEIEYANEIIFFLFFVIIAAFLLIFLYVVVLKVFFDT